MNDPLGLGVIAGARPEPGWFVRREPQPWRGARKAGYGRPISSCPGSGSTTASRPRAGTRRSPSGATVNLGERRASGSSRASSRVAAIRWLLAQGADVEVGNPLTGSTPLHGAAISGSIAVAAVLLDEGARVDAGDVMQRTALHFAAAYGHKAMVRFLLDRGHPLDTPDHAGAPTRRTRRAGERRGGEQCRGSRQLPRRGPRRGGWRKYTLAPRVRLLALHKALPALQKADGATVASVPVHEAVFASDALPRKSSGRSSCTGAATATFRCPRPPPPSHVLGQPAARPLPATVPFPVGGAAFPVCDCRLRLTHLTIYGGIGA